MNQQHRCTIAGITVQFDEGGKRFAVGDLVDLDAQARPGLTWRTALGTFAETFEPVVTKTVKRPAEE